ncbi:MAG TPA: 6-carboxytetrahydropterin synthase [Terriglobia bacterium]|nr:6-carboxytetrahydropterin synthase [Terriglobia bacterium]
MRADLTKRYRFSASHRLHSAALTEDENWRIYGKCNNPHGHGHNYALHVTVSGPVDAETGMVLDLAVLDLVVGEEVIEPFDRTFLNVEAFRQTIPTTENLCMEIFRRLNARLMKEPSHGAARLKKVLLEETSLNYFEYEG